MALSIMTDAMFSRLKDPVQLIKQLGGTQHEWEPERMLQLDPTQYSVIFCSPRFERQGIFSFPDKLAAESAQTQLANLLRGPISIMVVDDILRHFVSEVASTRGILCDLEQTPSDFDAYHFSRPAGHKLANVAFPSGDFNAPDQLLESLIRTFGLGFEYRYSHCQE